MPLRHFYVMIPKGLHQVRLITAHQDFCGAAIFPCLRAFIHPEQFPTAGKQPTRSIPSKNDPRLMGIKVEWMKLAVNGVIPQKKDCGNTESGRERNEQCSYYQINKPKCLHGTLPPWFLVKRHPGNLTGWDDNGTGAGREDGQPFFTRKRL